ncbi:hypothetical protein GGR57DRAFT_453114 [Xylariaceae sp. FL1272]|nr:hypothetical protein GGR57DRAFT_453114 [Xylariaceae sp. FL1272]
MKIPAWATWEEAAAIGGTAIATLGVAFHVYLDLFPGAHVQTPLGADQSYPVLVYGGGTATGTMAIQLLKA